MRRRNARGSGTQLMVAFAGVLLLVGAAVTVVAAMLVEHRRAQSAADLAALAGAAALLDGRAGCEVARDVAARNGAAVVSCVVDRREVVVHTRIKGPRSLGQRGDLEGHARAGPVSG
ncbi:MAG: Rv3654c family TadE-like protein [Nocardioides sp.]